MNIKDRMILDEFKKERENFIKLEEIAVGIIRKVVKKAGILVASIEHRVKNEKSLEVKLYKNGDYYQSLSDLMDLFGARVVCYFADDVDKIGKYIEEAFDVDWENSSDKRALIQADSFGYLSLHYICSLKEGHGYSKELTSKKFEIQIRTILQHAWAAINHDLGYKNEFGVPKDVIREFARLAGLLEIADNEFARTRDHIKAYTEEIRSKIINEDASEVNIDLISLREYMLRNKKMLAFIKQLASIDGAEIAESEPDNYIPQLRFLGIDTIGKMQDMLERNKDIALKLANRVLVGAELDILASNVALRFVCQAELILNNYSLEAITEFMQLTIKDKLRAQRQANRLLKAKEELGV